MICGALNLIPSIPPSKTIEDQERSSRLSFPDVYTRGRPRQTLLRRAGVLTPFTVDGDPSILPHPLAIAVMEFRKLGFGSFHPAEKKPCILRAECERTKEHPIRVEPAPLVIYVKGPRGGGEKQEKRAAPSSDCVYDHGNGKYDFGYLPLLPRRANNSAIVERARTRKNPLWFFDYRLLLLLHFHPRRIVDMMHKDTARQSAATICFTCVDAVRQKKGALTLYGKISDGLKRSVFR